MASKNQKHLQAESHRNTAALLLMFGLCCPHSITTAELSCSSRGCRAHSVC
jgi:hypothetical protein